MISRNLLTKSAMICAGLLILAVGSTSWAQDASSDSLRSPESIALPSFEKEGGMPLYKAFLERKSTKSYDPDRKLSMEEVSRILWAAGGVNRPNGKRTVFSARAQYPVDILIALPEGVFQYEYKEHTLKKLLPRDIRVDIVKQSSYKQAGMIVLYVINVDVVLLGRMEYADMEIGCMGQNVHLEAENLGLGACIFAGIDADAAAKVIGLTEKQIVRIGQAVGGPK